MTFWQVLIVIAIVAIPLAAAVVVTIWTVPRPGSRPPRPQAPAHPPVAEAGEEPATDADDATPEQP